MKLFSPDCLGLMCVSVPSCSPAPYTTQLHYSAHPKGAVTGLCILLQPCPEVSALSSP